MESKRQATFPREGLSNRSIKIYSIKVNERKQKNVKSLNENITVYMIKKIFITKQDMHHKYREQNI